MRLNIFALPQRTMLLFSLIALVIALPLGAALGGETPLCAPFLVFWMLLLPLRRFMRQPDLEIEREEMAPLSEEVFPALTKRVKQLAKEVGLRRPPCVLGSSHPRAVVRAFGSFTRHYLVFPLWRAEMFEEDLKAGGKRCQGAEAILLHELAHFVNRDIVPVRLSRALLVVAIGFLSLSLVTNALTPWVYNVLVGQVEWAAFWPPELFTLAEQINPEAAVILRDPPRVTGAAWMRYQVFNFTAHWPLIVGSGLLLLFFWTMLLRTQELYADARAAQWSGDPERVLNEVHFETLRPMWRPQPEPVSTAERVRLVLPPLQALPARVLRLRPPLAFYAGRRLISWADWSQWGPVRKVRRLLDPHPDVPTREACLDDPVRLYGQPWEIGAVAGVTVVLLNLTLGSLFLSRYVRGPNATVPFVLGFVILSLSLLPTLLAAPETLPRAWRQAVAVFTAIKLTPQLLLSGVLTLGMLMDPTLIEQAAYTLILAPGEELPPLGVSPLYMLEIFVVRPFFLFALVMPITLLFWLWLDARIKRRALTWYGAPAWQHPMEFCWGITAWLALLLWTIVLPFYNEATVPTAHSLTDPLTAGRLALGLLAAAGGALFLLVQDRRYAGRCLRCGAVLAPSHDLKKPCECGERFHPRIWEPDRPASSGCC